MLYFQVINYPYGDDLQVDKPQTLLVQLILLLILLGALLLVLLPVFLLTVCPTISNFLANVTSLKLSQ